MGRRVVKAWPYALALAVGFAVVAVIGFVALAGDPGAVMGVVILWGYIVQPLALTVGAIVLGVRRGFDPVTLFICLVVYVVAYAVLGRFMSDPNFFVSYVGTALCLCFLPAVAIGTIIGVVVWGVREAHRGDGRPDAGVVRDPVR